MLKVKATLVNGRTVVPTYASEGTGSIALTANLAAPLVIEPNSSALIGSGIVLHQPSTEMTALILPAPQVVAQGVFPANIVGQVDADNHYELQVPLHNFTPVPFTVNKGDVIANLVFLPIIKACLDATPVSGAV